MKFWANLGTIGQAAVGAVVVAVAGAVGIGLYQARPVPDEVAVAPQPQPAAPAAQPAPPADDTAEADATTQPDQTTDAAPVPPTFDVVRIEPDGNALVAGEAAPEAQVDVLVDGDAVTGAQADRDGKFVALFDLPPSPDPRLLTLSMSTKSGVVIASDAVVIIEGVAPELVAAAPPATTESEAGTQAAPNATDRVSEETAAVPPEANPAQVPQAGGPAGINPQPGTAGSPATPGAEPGQDPQVATAPADRPQGEAEPAAPAAPEQVAVATTAGEAAPQGSATPSVPQGQAAAAQAPQADTNPAPVDDPVVVTEQVVEPQAPAAVAEAPAAPETVVTETPAPEAAEIAQADPAQSPQKAPDAAPAVAEKAPSAPVGAATPDRGPSVIIADRSGVRVVPQTGNAQARELTREVVIEAISYDEQGAVDLTGRGAAESFVRLYLNNKALTTEPIGPDGRWSSKGSDIAPGLYTLRVDQLNAEGDVTSRFETPFKREAPDTVAAANVLKARRNQSGVAVVTVQPGFTLWAIARENYGDGVRYVAVYEANRAQIRDPDLIYPGQVFRVPGAE